MFKFKQKLDGIRLTAGKLRKWFEDQRSRRIASRSDGVVFLFAAITALVSSVVALCIKNVFPQYEKILEFWPIMPLRMRVVTLLITVALLAWSGIGFSFGLLCGFYSKEFIRRLES